MPTLLYRPWFLLSPCTLSSTMHHISLFCFVHVWYSNSCGIFFVYAHCIPSTILQIGSRGHGSSRREHNKKRRGPLQPSPLPNGTYKKKQVIHIICSLKRSNRACSSAEQKYLAEQYATTEQSKCLDSYALTVAVGKTCLDGGLGCPMGSNGPGVVTASTAR